MLLSELAEVSAALSATRSRSEKTRVLAAALHAAEPGEIEVVTSYLAGSLRQRRTGVSYRGLPREVPPAGSPSLHVLAVDALFEELSTLSGPGSALRRRGLLESLLARATADEQRYLAALVVGETRQGALDGLMLEAVALASGLPATAIRQAAMFAGSTPLVAAAALNGGRAAVDAFGLEVGRAVRPMLAASAKTIPEALAKADPSGAAVSVEAKLDGVRLQAHKRGDAVRLFTRSLDDITERLPEVAELVRALPADTLVLDGEVLALDSAGRPRPFQETSSRAMSDAGPTRLSAFFFDLLQRDEHLLIDRPLATRQEALASLVPPAGLVDRLVTADPDAAEGFLADVLAAGHEGVVVKNLGASYEAGRRGSSWVKVKPVHTLDLVVLAVEWGSGRRRGWLSNIHLGARDPRTGGYVMLGKTFKGMTDELLAWQTTRFQELETHRDDWTVFVRPEQVVEIAFDGLQRSTRYPGGLALRFARVIRYRDDKSAVEADTIDTVRALAGLAS